MDEKEILSIKNINKKEKLIFITKLYRGYHKRMNRRNIFYSSLIFTFLLLSIIIIYLFVENKKLNKITMEYSSHSLYYIN